MWSDPSAGRSASLAAPPSSSAQAASGPTPGTSDPGPSSSSSSGPPKKPLVKLQRFGACFAKEAVDLNELRELLWSGVPDEADPSVRAKAWQLMLGYLPVHVERQVTGLSKKRREYRELVKDYFERSPEMRSDNENQILRQIRVDIPRTNPGFKFFGDAVMHGIMERTLFIWALRNPASGYVQGINDLITPFLVVFLASYLNKRDEDLHELEISEVPSEVLEHIEADAYWCLSKMLADIQDHYTFGQPGIQRMVLRLKEIVKRIDEALYDHLTNNGLEFLQFSFRWMNCFLMREFPMRCVIRLWDTYIAEQASGFSNFHVYVCAGGQAAHTEEAGRPLHRTDGR